MTRLLRPWCAPVLPLACAVLLLGCGGVREDRTITFSATGDQVGFQHGQEGVFVADKEGGGLTRIFTPAKDVIAVGTPLWAPNDRRLIFTTARALGGGNGAPTLPQFDEDPAGRVFHQQPAVYTCWLRDEPKGDAVPEPRELFTAQVDHVGYVAAGLAVRWHPEGDRVLYVNQVGAGHAVFEFDLGTKKSRRVFPPRDTAQAVVFDWSPDGTHLACLLGNTPGNRDDGIWVGRGGADWWHVPESRTLAHGELPSALESLKAARPAWTKDGTHFAFASSLPGAKPNDPARHFLRLTTLDGRRVETLLEAPLPIHDLAWRPDGERLGFLSGGDGGLLQVADVKGQRLTVTPKPARSFAGWDAAGRHLAYTTADAIPFQDAGGFSLLFFPDPLARDALWIAAGDGKESGGVVISGLRTTFARWSPRDEKLSLWFTFAPTHHSLFSSGLGWGLRPGDPAAVIDATTGKVSWLAVNANEKAQVGHYHLMKRDYAQAWHWYEEARRDRAAHPEPEERRSGWDVVGPRPFRDVSFFESYCLDKLGRRDEAAARLAEFRAKARRLLPSDEELDTLPIPITDDKVKSAEWLRGEVRSLVPLARDFYVAEVFLSLDAAEDGEAFFRKALGEAAADDDRLSAAVVLAQLLALQGRADDYAAVVLDSLAPLVAKSLHAQGGEEAGPLNPPIPVWLAGLTILPLAGDNVLAKVSNARVEQWLRCCRRFREESARDELRLIADIMMERAYGRLGRAKEQNEVRDRLRANPSFNGGDWQPANFPSWDEVIRADPKAAAMVERSGLLGLMGVRAMLAFSKPADAPGAGK
jgi:hypothetical protein